MDMNCIIGRVSYTPGNMVLTEQSKHEDRCPLHGKEVPVRTYGWLQVVARNYWWLQVVARIDWWL